MKINIRGARENNLKNVDVDFYNGLTVVTGVSGSGKTSLVFDTLYKEARRRFMEAFISSKNQLKLTPARVDSITGLGPSIALGQNILNRNPNSTVASATGILPFLRLLYARYGERKCHECGAELSILKEDELIQMLEEIKTKEKVEIQAILMRQVIGSHKTLLGFLEELFSHNKIIVDGKKFTSLDLNFEEGHDIYIKLEEIDKETKTVEIRDILNVVSALGANSIYIKGKSFKKYIALHPFCVKCGSWIEEIEPTHFNRSCPYCKGKGCDKCNQTGLPPIASNVSWQGLLFPVFLSKTIEDLYQLFSNSIQSASRRLIEEIKGRLSILKKVGLGYLSLDRVSPSLSRGESQRVRLAVVLTSKLEDIIHVLDEPTIGQHPSDVMKLLPVFNELGGAVIFIEHDRQAAAFADYAIDMGLGAGVQGGEIVFKGFPEDLWKKDTPSGKYFSSRENVVIPKTRPPPKNFLRITGAHKHNLKNIDIKIALNRINIITGVSGSGKSTLVDDILFSSLKKGELIGCKAIDGPKIKPILVDQGPIGNNPRSNPATYTKIADIIRLLFEKVTGFDATNFSFNTKQGACPTCNGMGAIEVQLRNLPSTWIICTDCGGDRFTDKILEAKIHFDKNEYSIAEFYELPISFVRNIFEKENRINSNDLKTIQKMLRALDDIGLGYLSLGQPSPTLSGGEAQRVKLSKFLGKKSLKNQLIILDEPSTGLHPKDLTGLIKILDRLVNTGATLVIVEHNTDLIRSADWIIDLGPGSGPDGGKLIYQGKLEGLEEVHDSLTAVALKNEHKIIPNHHKNLKNRIKSSNIIIENARIHNLKNVDVKIPKQKLTVITGISGSGKSSLIVNTLEKEARRRYLETLSMYERQGIKESSEALVGNISGLGVTTLITSEKISSKWFLNIRNTIGITTDIFLHLANLFAYLGEIKCPNCGIKMIRQIKWVCPRCKLTKPIAKPKHFLSSNYSAACLKCHGIGSLQIPNPDKLIIHPNKPLCGGAMHSPGFFPKGYLCKPYNGGYYVIQALSLRHRFDPFKTSWIEMSETAKNAFLFGDDKPLKVKIENRKGQITERNIKYLGFYEHWIRDWDTGGTYTDRKICETCGGSKLRPQYLEINLKGYNFHELSELPLDELLEIIKKIPKTDIKPFFVKNSLNLIIRRLDFFVRTGLNYINLNRITETLSAGEAQRVRLAGIVGSELSSLTVLLDEPTRGLHPTEVDSLINVLLELRDMGNTVVIIEHDPLVINRADYIIDLGPEAGNNGGYIVAQGSPQEIKKKETITGLWLSGKKKIKIINKRRNPRGWLKVYGAKANNLKGEIIKIPKGTLVGICGISGSGKSTLLIDTIGRALAPKKHTTSVAREILEPGVHDKIEGKLSNTIIIDQVKAKMGSPINFLGIKKNILKLYSETEDAKVLGLDEKLLSKNCSECKGAGYQKIDMQFLPDVIELCDTCKGSGYLPEAWHVHYKDVSLPEINNLTINETIELFKENKLLVQKLKYAQMVGLGYLTLNQPARELSGGEAQRLKIVKELNKSTKKKTLYILDEPTIGQHLEDISKLIDTLHLLVKRGNTVLIIEHHPYVLYSCDWLIELKDGKVIESCTPEEFAKKKTPTSSFIKEIIEGNR